MWGGRAKTRSLPSRPRCPTFLPQRLQQPLVPQRVHALPETIVPTSGKLAVGSQALEGVCLQAAAVAFQVIEEGRLEDQKTAVYPAFTYLWLLCELRNHVAVEHQATEPCG